MAITPTRFVEIEGVNLSFIVALTLHTMSYILFKKANQSISNTPQ